MGGHKQSPYFFPRRFALGVFGLLLAVLCVAWGVHLSDSACASAAFAAVTAVCGAAILVVILRPQRVGGTGFAQFCGDEPEEDTDCEDVSDCGENAEKNVAAILPVQVMDKIERQVRDAVEHDRMYLNPDLTKAALVSLLGTNDLYLHIVLRQRFGPFNKYINTLRMDYAIRYENEHPGIKREELALKSGFGSVRTYYRAKMQYDETKREPQRVTEK